MFPKVHKKEKEKSLTREKLHKNSKNTISSKYFSIIPNTNTIES